MNKNPQAWMALALGLLFPLPLLNLLTGAAAVVLGIGALREVRGGKTRQGKKPALAAVFLGTLPYYFALAWLLQANLDVDTTARAGTVLLLFGIHGTAVITLLKKTRLL